MELLPPDTPEGESTSAIALKENVNDETTDPDDREDARLYATVLAPVLKQCFFTVRSRPGTLEVTVVRGRGLK